MYKVSAAISTVLDLAPVYRADLLITGPKLLQALIAAVGDYYTWKLGRKIYGDRSNEAWATVRRVYSSIMKTLLVLSAPRLMLCACAFVACINHLQSMAVVLLHSYFVQLLRDNPDSHCAFAVAMALVDRSQTFTRRENPRARRRT